MAMKAAKVILMIMTMRRIVLKTISVPILNAKIRNRTLAAKT
jgi:hypothetical protein